MDSAGAKSVISNDIQELTEGREQISKRVQGHKANLSNPSTSCPPFFHFDLLRSSRRPKPSYNRTDTSEASKDNSKKEIERLGGDASHYSDEKNPHSKEAAEKLEGSRVV
jgi:hypothetical protein